MDPELASSIGQLGKGGSETSLLGQGPPRQ